MFLRLKLDGNEIWCGPMAAWYRVNYPLDDGLRALVAAAVLSDTEREVHTGAGVPDMSAQFWLRDCPAFGSQACSVCPGRTYRADINERFYAKRRAA